MVVLAPLGVHVFVQALYLFIKPSSGRHMAEFLAVYIPQCMYGPTRKDSLKLLLRDYCGGALRQASPGYTVEKYEKGSFCSKKYPES